MKNSNDFSLLTGGVGVAVLDDGQQSVWRGPQHDGGWLSLDTIQVVWWDHSEDHSVDHGIYHFILKENNRRGS